MNKKQKYPAVTFKNKSYFHVNIEHVTNTTSNLYLYSKQKLCPAQLYFKIHQFRHINESSQPTGMKLLKYASVYICSSMRMFHSLFYSAFSDTYRNIQNFIDESSNCERNYRLEMSVMINKLCWESVTNLCVFSIHFFRWDM